MTGTVSWAELSFIVGLLIAAAGIVAGVIVRIMSSLSRIQREHDEFRIEVAKTYATLAALDKVQSAVAEEMRGLRQDFAGGFDRVIEVMKTVIPPRARGK